MCFIGPSKKAKFKIYRQSESLFEHFSRLGTSQSASCSFCVVLEGVPTQKALAGPDPHGGASSAPPYPLPSWAGGVPPSRTLPGTAPPTVSPSPFQPPPPPPPQPSRLDPLVIPQGWKQAIVCPIFKKGSRKSPSNYRPVSLTSVCCKVMESIVYESMVFFLRSNSLISKDQFGFLARRSTCTQLLITLNEWTLLILIFVLKLILCI